MFTKRTKLNHNRPITASQPPLNQLQQLLTLETDLLSIIGTQNIPPHKHHHIFNRLEQLYLLNLQNQTLGMDMLDKCLRILGPLQCDWRIRLLYYHSHEMILEGCNHKEVETKLLQCFNQNMLLENKFAMGFKSGLVFCQLTRNSYELQKVIPVLIDQLQKQVGFTTKDTDIQPTPSLRQQTIRQIYAGKKQSKQKVTHQTNSPCGRNRRELYKYLYQAYLTAISRLQSEPIRKFYNNSLKCLRNTVNATNSQRGIQNTFDFMESHPNSTLQQFMQVLDCNALQINQNNNPPNNDKSTALFPYRKRQNEDSRTKDHIKFNRTADTTQSLKHSHLSDQRQIANATISATPHHRTLKPQLKSKSQSKLSHHTSKNSTPENASLIQNHSITKDCLIKRNHNSLLLNFSNLPQQFKDKSQLKKKKLKENNHWQQPQLPDPQITQIQFEPTIRIRKQLNPIDNTIPPYQQPASQNNPPSTHEKETIKSILPSLSAETDSILNIDGIIEREFKWVISQFQIGQQQRHNPDSNSSAHALLDENSECEQITYFKLPKQSKNTICTKVYAQTIRGQQTANAEKKSMKEIQKDNEEDSLGVKIAKTNYTNDRICKNESLESEQAMLSSGQIEQQCNLSTQDNELGKDMQENIGECVEEDICSVQNNQQPIGQVQIVSQYMSSMVEEIRLMSDLTQEGQQTDKQRLQDNYEKDLYDEIITEWMHDLYNVLSFHIYDSGNDDTQNSPPQNLYSLFQTPILPQIQNTIHSSPQITTPTPVRAQHKTHLLKKQAKTHSITISYNEDYNTTEYCKTLHHWLLPQLKINADGILLTITHPDNHTSYTKLQTIDGMRTIKDDSYQAVENQLTQFFQQYPQSKSPNVSHIWETVVNRIQHLTLLPAQILLKQVEVDHFWQPLKYSITLSHVIRTNQVVARCQKRKLKSQPLDVPMNQGLQHLEQLLTPQNIIVNKNELLFKHAWVSLGKRHLNIQDGHSDLNLHHTFHLFEKCRGAETLLFSYCIKSTLADLSMQFHGVKLKDRSKIWNNIDAIIGFCLKQTNHSIVFNTQDLHRLLLIL